VLKNKKDPFPSNLTLFTLFFMSEPHCHQLGRERAGWEGREWVLTFTIRDNNDDDNGRPIADRRRDGPSDAWRLRQRCQR
jgi:hypothetical protein